MRREATAGTAAGTAVARAVATMGASCTGQSASDDPQPHSSHSNSMSRPRSVSTRRSRMSSLRARRSSRLALWRYCDRPIHP